ncbi:MAG: hypothetical protein CMM50_08935 [Rhodospirillaceae bacterium]|nr:hypothetical protein [Rhodospirillaceae bacterium]
MSGLIAARLQELGITLPAVPAPIANFVPFVRAGEIVVLAGQTCEWNGVVRYAGKIGIDFDIETGREAARICALNLLAALEVACEGNLDRVRRCLRLGGFVNCDPDFDRVPAVIDGASDLMMTLFGANGGHARTAVGVATLPQRAAVEVDAIFEIA